MNKPKYEPKPGEVTLFDNSKRKNDIAPCHTGYIIAHRDIKAGEKVSLSLWKGKLGSPKTYSGKISDYMPKTEMMKKIEELEPEVHF